MTKQRKMLLVLAIIGGVGFFLPWFMECYRSMGCRIAMYGFQTYPVILRGVIPLAFVAIGVLALSGDRLANLPARQTVVVALCGLCNALVTGLHFVVMEAELTNFQSGIGLQMSWWASAGTLLALLVAWFLRSTPTQPRLSQTTPD